MSTYNTHAHIFNAPSVPDAFITNYQFPSFIAPILRKAVTKPALRWIILKLLRLKFARRYAALIETSLHRYQDEVFDKLSVDYPADNRFVILTMNFDYMTGDAPLSNYNHYETQLHEILTVKEKFGSRIIPFLSVDPRAGVEACMESLQTYLNPDRQLGLAGIKLYPPLGYYPFHPTLEKIYAYAEKHSIPIITHCNRGGGAFYSGRFYPSVMSYFSFNPTALTRQYLDTAEAPTKPRDFADILMHPANYYDVLDRFPELKICLAHFGGDEEVIAHAGNKAGRWNWTDCIIDLIKKYKNVYTDVSFTLGTPEANQVIKTMLDSGEFSDRILFGTDFFLSAQKGAEKELVKNFFSTVGEHYREKLCKENPERFLSSTFFTA